MSGAAVPQTRLLLAANSSSNTVATNAGRNIDFDLGYAKRARTDRIRADTEVDRSTFLWFLLM